MVKCRKKTRRRATMPFSPQGQRENHPRWQENFFRGIFNPPKVKIRRNRLFRARRSLVHEIRPLEKSKITRVDAGMPDASVGVSVMRRKIHMSNLKLLENSLILLCGMFELKLPGTFI